MNRRNFLQALTATAGTAAVVFSATAALGCRLNRCLRPPKPTKYPHLTEKLLNKHFGDYFSKYGTNPLTRQFTELPVGTMKEFLHSTAKKTVELEAKAFYGLS